MLQEHNSQIIAKFMDYLLLRNYKENSIRSYANQLKHYLSALEIYGKDIQEVDILLFESIVKEWAAEMPVNSLNARISKCRKLHDWMVLRGLMAVNPVVRDLYIRPKQLDRQILSLRDIETIKAQDKALFDHTKLAIRLMIYAGLRVSECRQIVKNSIKDYENATTFQVDSDKFSKSRTCILRDKETRALLLKWLKNSHRFGDYLKLGSQAAIQAYLNSLKDKLSFRATTHDLRRFYATSLAREGVPVPIISKLLGHDNIATTHRYIFIKDLDILNQFDVGKLIETPAP